MTDNNEQAEHTATASIMMIYTKDSSYEAPNTPDIFQEPGEGKQPETEVSLETVAEQVGDNVYEAVLSITVTTKLGDKAMYLAEIHQAGIFELQGFDEQMLDYMLGVWCPEQLFPYARETLSAMVGKGGFMPLYLEPQNFENLYRQNKESQQPQH